MARIRKKARKGAKKAISIGIKIAKIGKNEFEREFKKVLKGKSMDKKRAKKILGAILREARISAKNFAAFARQESTRVGKKIKPLMNQAAKRAKARVRKTVKRAAKRAKRGLKRARRRISRRRKR